MSHSKLFNDTSGIKSTVVNIHQHNMNTALNIYKSWMGWLAKAKDFGKGRPDGKHGRIIAHGTEVHFKYHDTILCVLYPTGVIRIQNCGYKTATTKKRLNRILNTYGYTIEQRKFVWWFSIVHPCTCCGNKVELPNAFMLQLEPRAIQ